MLQCKKTFNFYFNFNDNKVCYSFVCANLLKDLLTILKFKAVFTVNMLPTNRAIIMLGLMDGHFDCSNVGQLAAKVPLWKHTQDCPKKIGNRPHRTPHCLKNYPLLWTNPQTQLPASTLDPSDLSSQIASISDQPFCHNGLDRQTDRHT